MSPEDRLIKPLLTARGYGLKVDSLILGVGAALNYFSDEDKQSVDLHEKIEKNGIECTIKEICKIEDEELIRKIAEAYKSFR